MMKHFLKIFLMAAFIVAASQNSALAKNELDFTLVNNSGKAFYRLYVSPRGICGVNCGDVLGTEILQHGESKKIKVPSYKYWDIRVVFKDETFWLWYNIDLQKYSTIMVDKEGKAHFS